MNESPRNIGGDECISTISTILPPLRTICIPNPCHSQQQQPLQEWREWTPPSRATSVPPSLWQTLLPHETSDHWSCPFRNPPSPRSQLSFDKLGQNESLKDLVAQKRTLKMLLKEYNLHFFTQNGRMPNKSEKEPLRHLYELYNMLKRQISILEEAKEEG